MSEKKEPNILHFCPGREGIASFRVSAFGDISHLYVHDEPPAFAARFCEMYSNEDERH